MLYVSTRNRTDSYTAHRALREDRAPDGGMYVPFRLPHFTEEEILLLKNRSFGDNVAQILNLFFSARLTGWDVEFCCGRYPVKSLQLPHRLLVAEAWHNTASSYSYMEQALYAKLCGDNTPPLVADWAKIAIRIAVLFAVYGGSDAAEKCDVLDVAVDADAFFTPIAAWYARKMGLPIGTVICGSNESSAVWDLLHRGDLNTAIADHEIVGLERLIYFTLGQNEALRFATVCGNRRIYHLDEELLNLLNDGLFAAVISSSRIPSVIKSFYRSCDYVLDTAAAVSFGALQDYRARTGESRLTLLTSLSSPTKDFDALTGILGLDATVLERTVNRQ